MPASEYVSASAGSLKLKGVNPSSKVSKSHRKKRPKPETLPASSTPSAEKLEDSAVLDRNDHLQDSAETVEKDGLAADRQLEKLGDDARPDEDEQGLVHLPKTEAELRHEERRRKRVSCPDLLHP